MDDILDSLYEDSQDPKEEHEFPCCPFLRETCPRVHDFVRYPVWKGHSRTPGKVSVSTDNGLWLVSLTDVDHSRSVSVTGSDFVQGLATLDQLISSKQLHWRYWGNPTRKGGKKATGTKR